MSPGVDGTPPLLPFLDWTTSDSLPLSPWGERVTPPLPPSHFLSPRLSVCQVPRMTALSPLPVHSFREHESACLFRAGHGAGSSVCRTRQTGPYVSRSLESNRAVKHMSKSFQIGTDAVRKTKHRNGVESLPGRWTASRGAREDLSEEETSALCAEWGAGASPEMIRPKCLSARRPAKPTPLGTK